MMTTPRTRRASGTRQHTNGRQPTSVPPASDTRTRLIRFRLNPRSSSDQQILAWLLQHAPYYRADAIRTALLTHILRRSIEAPAPPPTPMGEPTASRHPPADVPSVAAQKLGKLFST